MHAPIVSPQNPRAKAWSALLHKRGRDEQGLYLLEGVHLVGEALKAGALVETVLLRQGSRWPDELDRTLPGETEFIEVSDAVLAKCSDARTPQGIIAIVRKPEPDIGQGLYASGALVIAVDGVQDPGNLGTIVRCADAVGASAVLLGEGTVDLYNPKTLRSTMGSLFHLPVLQAELPERLRDAADAGVQVVGTSLAATESCYELDLTKPTWFVVGNEGSGVSPAIEGLVTRRVIIPMPGQAESLNVAMASTVLLFEAMRQRRISPSTK